jgi:hypothetical protein
METIKKFNSLIDDINKICELIMRTALPIMTKMANDKKFLFDKIKEKYPAIEEKDIKLKMKQMSESLIKDSQTIKREFSHFIDMILNLNEDKSKCEFLTQVWYGDAYGSVGLKSLELLLEDLNQQLKDCNITFILENI